MPVDASSPYVSGSTVTVLGNTPVKNVTINVLPRKGDINSDGAVDIADALYYYQVALGTKEPPSNVTANMILAPVVDGRPQPDPNRTTIKFFDLIAVLERVVGLW